MNKKELFTAVHDRVNTGSVSQATVDQICNGLLETIQDELAAGREVNITGFGKFGVTKLKARKGRNPSTGEALQIAARNKAKFTPGAALKGAVN